MMEVKNDLSSHLWRFHNRKNANPKRSSWLQTTLSDLEEKTQAMLKLIEEDADSFAKRAEMYYKKRPQLVNMVGDFHQAHRSLAERYDQIKNRPDKWNSCPEKSYDSFSKSYELEDQSEESEVSDPEQEGEIQFRKGKESEEASLPVVGNEEVMKLREEIERLKEENKNQKEELMQKDEEKREVIRQLTLSLDLLMEENVKLRKSCKRESLKKHDIFWRRFFNVSPRSQPSLFGLFLFRV